MDEWTLKELGVLLLDLDRCEHGRHVQDQCFSCPEGQSAGNVFLIPGQRIGTTMMGEAITVPSWDKRNDPKAWITHE